MKIYKLLIPFLTLILLIGIVQAAPGASTLTFPLASSTMAGHTMTINITTSTLINVTHCNVTFTSTGDVTANLSEVVALRNRSKTTEGWKKFNATFDSFKIEDGIYTVGGFCYNSTPYTGSSGGNNVSTITAVTGVKVDNGYPPAATARTPADAEVDTDGVVTFSGTVTDKNTTGCYLIFDSAKGPVPTISTTMKYATTSCTLEVDRLPMSNAGYYWGIKTSDGTTYTNSAHNQLQVKTQGNIAQKALLLQELGQLDGGSSTIVWIVIIAGVLYLFRDKIFKKK